MMNPSAGMGPEGTQHQQLIDTLAGQPQGGPNDLVKFLFTHPGFLTDYQKTVIRAWMRNPAAGEAQMTEENSEGTAPAGLSSAPVSPAAAPASPTGPAGLATGGQPAASPAAPAGLKPASPAPKTR